MKEIFDEKNERFYHVNTTSIEYITTATVSGSQPQGSKSHMSKL